ncbi:hypothetical protein [Pedobacter sandarakinus]|uniref:hypothetical protein n=1 Tax=Pedobacter sandarakinus TaxID=353156 RepID=UPI0022450C80|nr:hypothetical protein [Pedobacter sandarakinus]MCX2574002.1 hypothetical protein [Pedobacter sandarakinus]
MKKFDFNTQGIKALQMELYKHPDAYLAQQAEAIKLDFIRWIAERFNLNAEQLKHLYSLPYPRIKSLSSQTAIAVEGRLPVTLIKPNLKPIVGYDSKLIVPTGMVRALATLDGSFEAEGSLEITITY